MKMNRQELQAALKEFRNQSLTEISLNSKTEVLQAEYDQIVESEKQYQTFCITVELNGNFIKVTAKGVRGYTLINHYLNDAPISLTTSGMTTTEYLVNSKYVTTEIIANIKSFQIPVLENEVTENLETVDDVELKSLNSITIAGVKVTTMTTEELATEFILIEDIEKDLGYAQLEAEIFKGDFTQELHLKIVRFLSRWIQENDECAAC